MAFVDFAARCAPNIGEKKTEKETEKESHCYNCLFSFH
jgi:hypothetical protein